MDENEFQTSLTVPAPSFWNKVMRAKGATNAALSVTVVHNEAGYPAITGNLMLAVLAPLESLAISTS